MDNENNVIDFNYIKSKLLNLIDSGQLDIARKLLESTEELFKNNLELISIKTVILILEGKIFDAEELLRKGLDVDPFEGDLLYNFAHICELKEDYNKAYELYNDAKFFINEDGQNDINEALIRIGKKLDNKVHKKRIAFFVKPNLDSFLSDIIEGLSVDYNVKKIVVRNTSQIDTGMKWADICWFEWCDELIVYGSRPEAIKKVVICRLHSYEAFTSNINNVNWDLVDKVVFVADHIRDYVISQTKLLNREKTIVIPNGVKIEKCIYRKKASGFNIAYVGYINYKKGPMLLLHTFKAIHDKDSRYKLYIAGQFQDGRDLLYFQQMIPEMGLQDAVFFQGWQDDLNSWLIDKDYIICTSILESQNKSVMQAMCKGIKPLIHNFVGAKRIYPEKYIWNTIDEAVSMVLRKEYNSRDYRSYIIDNFSMEKEINSIKELFDSLNCCTILSEQKEKPLVTVGIINYNCQLFLRECVESFLNQTYDNIEILLIDDCSSDGSREIIKDLENNFENIRGIYHITNSGGASKGIQDIIAEAKGKYFQWIASDDFVARDAVEKYVSFLERNSDIDYVYSNYNIVNENSDITDRWNYQLYSPGEVVCKVFHRESGVIPMNCMYRKSFFDKNNLTWIVYKGNDFSCDVVNSLLYIKYNMNFALLDRNLINYRIHSSNGSHNLAKRIMTIVSVYDFIINNFGEKIYFPDIEWEGLKDREQYKNLLIGNTFFKAAIRNMNLRELPGYIKNNSDEEEILYWIQDLLKEGLKYIRDGLSMEGSYNEELRALKKNFIDLMK